MVIKNKKGQEIVLNKKHGHSSKHIKNIDEEDDEEIEEIGEEEEEHEEEKRPKPSKSPKQQDKHTSKQQTPKSITKQTVTQTPTPKQQTSKQQTPKPQTPKQQTPKSILKQQTPKESPNNKSNETVIDIESDSDSDEHMESSDEHIESDDGDLSELEKKLKYLKTKSIILDKDGNYPTKLTKKEIAYWTKKNFKIENITIEVNATRSSQPNPHTIESPNENNSINNNITTTTTSNNDTSKVQEIKNTTNGNNNISGSEDKHQNIADTEPPKSKPTQQTAKKQQPTQQAAKKQTAKKQQPTQQTSKKQQATQQTAKKQQPRQQQQQKEKEEENKNHEDSENSEEEEENKKQPIKKPAKYPIKLLPPLPELPSKRSTRVFLVSSPGSNDFFSDQSEDSKSSKKSTNSTPTQSNKKPKPSIPDTVGKKSKIVTPPQSDYSSDDDDDDDAIESSSDEKIHDPNAWSSEEIEKLKKITNKLKTTDYNYWDKVSEYVGTKTAEQCHKKHSSNFRSPNPKKPSAASTKELSPISMKTNLKTNKGKRKLRLITEMNTLMPKNNLFDATPFKNKKKIAYVGSSDVDSDEDLFNDSIEARSMDKIFSEVHVDLSDCTKDIEEKVGKGYWDGYINKMQTSNKKFKSSANKKQQQQSTSLPSPISSNKPSSFLDREVMESVNVISKISNKYDKIKEKDNHQLDLDESKEDSYFGNNDDDEDPDQD